jgi:sulfate adenylyltransferase subunit 1 (EFTu-like GTPase family)
MSPSSERDGAATGTLFLVSQVFTLEEMGKIALAGHVIRGSIKVGDVLRVRESGSTVRVDGINFSKGAHRDNMFGLLIPADTRPVPCSGDYLEGTSKDETASPE